jgi:hypothetical protein
VRGWLALWGKGVLSQNAQKNVQINAHFFVLPLCCLLDVFDPGAIFKPPGMDLVLE